MIVVLDGPAGSGKSTAAKNLARRLRGEYLDTGAMYRAVTLKALRTGTHLEDDEGLTRLAVESKLSFSVAGDSQAILLDGEDVSDDIRSPRVNDAVSIVSAVAGVRDAMVELQREIGEEAAASGLDLVAEGRDMGTVVFPGADVKVYLTASPNERARRRHEDLRDLGHDQTLVDIEKSIVERDRLDSSRQVGPLRRAEDAVPIDTTDLGPEQVVDEIIRICQQR